MTRDEKIAFLRQASSDADIGRMLAIVLASKGAATAKDLPDEEIDMLVELTENMDAQLGGGEWLPGGGRG